MLEFKSTRHDEDELKISVLSNNTEIGYYILEENISYFWWDGFISENRFYDEIEQPYLLLQNIWLDSRKRGKGYGNQMMEHLLNVTLKQKYFKKFTHIYLYANSFDFSLDLETLKYFYSRFGFEEYDIYWDDMSDQDLRLSYRNNIMFKKL